MTIEHLPQGSHLRNLILRAVERATQVMNDRMEPLDHEVLDAIDAETRGLGANEVLEELRRLYPAIDEAIKAVEALPDDRLGQSWIPRQQALLVLADTVMSLATDSVPAVLSGEELQGWLERGEVPRGWKLVPGGVDCRPAIAHPRGPVVVRPL